MRLPDFTEFQAFNELRERMGAEQLGYFELFDPKVHLTGEERSRLENDGLLMLPANIRRLPDKTLAIKNSRVLAYNPDESWYRQRREYPSYHLAFCSEMAAFIKEQPEQEWLVTTRIAQDYRLLKIRSSGEVAVSEHGFVVCKHCLHLLRYLDFDLYRNRRRGYSEKVLNDFSLQQFYRLYQQYPLSFGARKPDQSEG